MKRNRVAALALAFVALLLGLAAAGSKAATAAAPSGTVVAWGEDLRGQTDVPAGLNGVVAISAGGFYSLALLGDGTVVGWGELSAPGGLDHVTAISAGVGHALALRDDGTIVAWGGNYYGQANIPDGLTGALAISAGGWHSLALKPDGTVVGWGLDDYGQATVPAGLAGVSAIAAGWEHSLALKGDGTVVAWGRDDGGQTDVPAGLDHVVAISAGLEHSLALKDDGTVVAWGSDFYGQTDVPAGLGHVVAISAGGMHSLALRDDGTVVGWGDDSYWQAQAPGGLSGVTAISAGGGHSLAIGAIVPGADVTPPVIDVPTGLVLDATGPDGLFLDYQVRVWDDYDPAPTVTCTPVSNSTFAIGETTVTCTAVDASGNSATATFVVHVCGPAEQTAELIQRVVDEGIENRGVANSLIAKLEAARQALLAPNQDNRASARHQLDAFINEVAAQSGKAIGAHAAQLLTFRAVRIETVMGYGPGPA